MLRKLIVGILQRIDIEVSELNMMRVYFSECHLYSIYAADMRQLIRIGVNFDSKERNANGWLVCK